MRILSSQSNPAQPFFMPARTLVRIRGNLCDSLLEEASGLWSAMAGWIDIFFHCFIYGPVDILKSFMDIGGREPPHFYELNNDFLGGPQYLFVYGFHKKDEYQNPGARSRFTSFLYCHEKYSGYNTHP